MKYVVIYILGLFLGACVACGTEDLFPTADVYVSPTGEQLDVVIDEPLKLPVAMFMKDCEERRKDCKQRLARIKEIKVVNMPDFDKSDKEIVIGLCYDGLFRRKVHVNKNIIDYADRYLQALIYHELGHCMYDLDHVKESDRLMSPAMPSFDVLIQDWPELVTELFTAIREKHGP